MVLSFSGIGSHDDVITVGMQYHIGLWTIIWQFLYVLDGALIKSSIIWTLLRLAKDLNRIYRYILWALFTLSWVTWQISWPVAIFQCKPVSAAWGEPGDCTSGQTVILHVSYFVSAANIFTDVCTALVPAFLLRHLQMKMKLKLITMFILSLGIFASVATTIRITYTWAYTAKVDRFCTSKRSPSLRLIDFQRLTVETADIIGKIVLLTVLECDLGIIAGSMPMLRRLFRDLAPSYGGDSGGTAPTPHRDVNLVTIGGSNGRRTHMKLSNIDDTIHESDHHSGDDDASTRHIIHVTREVEQDTVSNKDGPGNRFEVAVSGSRGSK